MSQKIKRFYSSATTAPLDNSFIVELDGCPIKSPGRQLIQLPCEKLADQLAIEWRQQKKFIDTDTMPLMQFASMVSDHITPQPDEARAEIVKYAHSDLLCYRVSEPDSLVERQNLQWDPVLVQFREKLTIEFATSVGIQYVEQNEKCMSRFASLIAPLESYKLGAVHLVTVMTGSAALAVALSKNWLTPQVAWKLAHLDEDFQAELWGEDDDAIHRRQRRYAEYSAAVRVFEC